MRMSAWYARPPSSEVRNSSTRWVARVVASGVRLESMKTSVPWRVVSTSTYRMADGSATPSRRAMLSSDARSRCRSAICFGVGTTAPSATIRHRPSCPAARPARGTRRGTGGGGRGEEEGRHGPGAGRGGGRGEGGRIYPRRKHPSPRRGRRLRGCGAPPGADVDDLLHLGVHRSLVVHQLDAVGAVDGAL